MTLLTQVYVIFRLPRFVTILEVIKGDLQRVLYNHGDQKKTKKKISAQETIVHSSVPGNKLHHREARVEMKFLHNVLLSFHPNSLSCDLFHQTAQCTPSQCSY